MAKKVLKVEITDDKMMDIAVENSKLFPDEMYLALGLFSASLMADIFKDAEEVEVDENPKVTSPDTIYHCGDHTFRVHKKAKDSFSIDHFNEGVFIGMKKVESLEKAFKYILDTLDDYLF